jgi:tetratricopeptide (TPR) repeat protein
MVVKRTILSWGPALLMVLTSLLLYGGSFEHARLPAEDELIWGNDAVAHGNFGSILLGRWQAGEYRAQVRPVATIVRAIEHAAYDFRRERFQFDQIILHGVAGALLFLLLRRLLGSWPVGALGGLLFVAHPGASQSVLYLGGLAEILSTIFFLGCLLALPDPTVPRLPRQPVAGRQRTVLIAALAALSMLSKEIGFLIPVVVGLMMLDPRYDRAERRRVYVAVAIGTAVALAWRFAALAATPEAIRRIPAIDPLTAVPFLKAVEKAMAGIGAEVGVVLFPLRLCHEYSWLLAAPWWASAGLTTLADLLIIAGIWAVVRSKQRSPLTPLVLLALLPLLAPALLAVQNGTVASERNLYLALPGWVGLLLLAGRGIARRKENLGPAIAGVAVGIALLLGVRTALRVPDFEDNTTLTQKAFRSCPRNPQLLFELGNEKFVKGDDAGAQKYYEESLALRPGFALASMNLAWTFFNQKDLGKALRVLDPVAVEARHVRGLRMVDAKANYLAALILMKQDRNREAAEAFERTLLFYPDHQGARGNLGLLYVRAPNYVDRGIEQLQWAIAHESNESMRLTLQKGLTAAKEQREKYIAERGGPPSQFDPPEKGVLGEPWKKAAEEGM